MAKVTFLKIDDDSMFHFGIASARASLVDSGHDAIILDGTFSPPRKKRRMLLDRITKECPDVVGLSVTDHDYLETLRFAQDLKSLHPHIHSSLGGRCPRSFPGRFLATPRLIPSAWETENYFPISSLCSTGGRAIGDSSVIITIFPDAAADGHASKAEGGNPHACASESTIQH